jgi:hypothetical protein
MKKALKTLLNSLDKICDEHGEVTDTHVREEMRYAVEQAVLFPVTEYALPDDFGMFDEKGNARVKTALAKFIASVQVEIAAAGLVTPESRLRAFQDLDVVSRDGNTYDEYFGYDDSLDKE